MSIWSNTRLALPKIASVGLAVHLQALGLGDRSISEGEELCANFPKPWLRSALGIHQDQRIHDQAHSHPPSKAEAVFLIIRNLRTKTTQPEFCPSSVVNNAVQFVVMGK
jgi:hypothetical protein